MKQKGVKVRAVVAVQVMINELSKLKREVNRLKKITSKHESQLKSIQATACIGFWQADDE